ncbi:FecR family protein [Novosphingobium soli]|uniref:FecR domain-containing protein n=1 Tax=Novosphingobium soli TaxID=574956 RepID=A0ABV6CUE6_9SPHN
MASDDTIREQALHWSVRANDPGFLDWEAFTAWLEEDPAHARAYDAVSSAVAEAADLAARGATANDDLALAPPTASRRAWLAGALAASLAAVAGLWLFQAERRDLYTVRTALGETRSLHLDAETRIDLAGGSEIALDRDDTRFARLEQGQALFTVRHDAAHPFVVAVGEERLVDLGTVFDVRHDAEGLSVAVSEGAVQFDPEGAAVRIAPGEVLQRRNGASDYTLSKVPAEQVGEWREGRLTFQAASLAAVAAQLSRVTGIEYAAAPAGSGTVSGSILVAPLRRDPAAIGPLLGVSVKADGGRWVIGAR